MLLLSISATGIIFIRKGGGREGGRSGSLRYAPQTNLCFLNYLCQLRFYKLNKSITQVYFEPAGRPEGSVAHLPAHSCAVLREPPGHSGTCVIQFPSHRTRFAAPAAAPERRRPANAKWELPPKDVLSQREGKPEPSCPFAQQSKAPRVAAPGTVKRGEAINLAIILKSKDWPAEHHHESTLFQATLT